MGDGVHGSQGFSICFPLRWARMLSTTTGSVITATTLNSSPQRGQTCGSTSERARLAAAEALVEAIEQREESRRLSLAAVTAK